MLQPVYVGVGVIAFLLALISCDNAPHKKDSVSQKPKDSKADDRAHRIEGLLLCPQNVPQSKKAILSNLIYPKSITISPNGNYAVILTGIRQIHLPPIVLGGKVRESVVRERYHDFVVVKIDGVPQTQAHLIGKFTASSGYTQSYGWTKEGDIVASSYNQNYRRGDDAKTQRIRSLYTPSDNGLSKKDLPRPLFNGGKRLEYVEGGSNPEAFESLTSVHNIIAKGCCKIANIFGEYILRRREANTLQNRSVLLEITKNKQFEALRFYHHSKNTIFPRSWPFRLFDTDVFRPVDMPYLNTDGIKTIPYFFMLETKLDGHTRLLKYSDKIGGGDWETVFDFGLNKNPHVSLDRYGTKIMWVRYDADTDADSDANNGSIHKPLSDTGKTLLDIVRVPGMFKASVEDMDKAGRLAIVKRSTKQGGDDYLLVDIKAKTMQLLGHCPAITNIDD